MFRLIQKLEWIKILILLVYYTNSQKSPNLIWQVLYPIHMRQILSWKGGLPKKSHFQNTKTWHLFFFLPFIRVVLAGEKSISRFKDNKHLSLVLVQQTLVVAKTRRTKRKPHLWREMVQMEPHPLMHEKNEKGGQEQQQQVTSSSSTKKVDKEGGGSVIFWQSIQLIYNDFLIKKLIG